MTNIAKFPIKDKVQFRKKRRRDHFEMMNAEIRPNIDYLLNAKGVIVPSMIASLIYSAKKVADEHANIFGNDYFKLCVQDIEKGGIGADVDLRE